MKINNKALQLPLKRLLSSLCALITLLIYFFVHNLSLGDKIILFILTVVFGCYYFSLEALEAIFIKHKITTDVLMVLGNVSRRYFLNSFVLR